MSCDPIDSVEDIVNQYLSIPIMQRVNELYFREKYRKSLKIRIY